MTSRAALRRRVFHLEYLFDTPTEDIRSVTVYISGYVDNPLRVFPAAHPAYDPNTRVHPDEHGRVVLHVTYYESYRIEAFLPREDWADPRGIQVHAAHVYGFGGVPDGRVRATLELATARTFDFR